MAVEVIVPSLGEVVDEVKILSWLKNEGDQVAKEEPLLEVESEKVTTEIPAPASGFLGRILYPQGSKVKITTVIAIIVAEGETIPETYIHPTPGFEAKASGAAAEPISQGEIKPDHIRVAPLARRIAEKEGIDLRLLKPTGPHGTIMKRDIEDYIAKRKEGKPVEERIKKDEAATVPAVPLTIAGQKIELTLMRKTIARRMAKSAFTAPHMCLFREIGMDSLLDLRETFQSSFQDPSQLKISINDFLLKAVALTLKEFPYLNARWEEEEIYLLPEINIGLAVALEEGLIVPAIADVDRLSLEEIARKRTELIERAKSGKLQKGELERGTFTITSLASFGISHFTAIINPPQSAILSVGETQEKLVLKDGKVIPKRFANFGICLDHRVADGSYGAKFLDAMKRRIENPIIAFLHF